MNERNRGENKLPMGERMFLRIQAVSIKVARRFDKLFAAPDLEGLDEKIIKDSQALLEVVEEDEQEQDS